MNRPWYKEFWPWFLIAVPIITLIMGGVLLKLAISTEDSLVVDDYYKEGKAINARFGACSAYRYLHANLDRSAVDRKIQTKFKFTPVSALYHPCITPI